MPDVTIVPRAEKYAESYNRAVDAVARERRYLATVQGFPLEGSRDYVRSMEQQNFPQYFALHEDRVVGWCDITPRSIPEFQHVGVLGMGLLPPFRGQGIGKRLLETTIEHARTVQRMERVELVVFESNANAVALYTRMGFEVEGKKERARKIDGVYDNELLMRKFISPDNAEE